MSHFLHRRLKKLKAKWFSRGFMKGAAEGFRNGFDGKEAVKDWQNRKLSARHRECGEVISSNDDIADKEISRSVERLLHGLVKDKLLRPNRYNVSTIIQDRILGGLKDQTINLTVQVLPLEKDKDK